jgi:hypothetical protein
VGRQRIAAAKRHYLAGGADFHARIDPAAIPEGYGL